MAAKRIGHVKNRAEGRTRAEIDDALSLSSRENWLSGWHQMQGFLRLVNYQNSTVMICCRRMRSILHSLVVCHASSGIVCRRCHVRRCSLVQGVPHPPALHEDLPAGSVILSVLAEADTTGKNMSSRLYCIFAFSSSQTWRPGNVRYVSEHLEYKRAPTAKRCQTPVLNQPRDFDAFSLFNEKIHFVLKWQNLLQKE